MKKLILPMLMIVIAIFNSCDGTEGPQGPKGDKGEDGADGEQGPPGTANVIYSSWFYAGTWSGSSGAWFVNKFDSQFTQSVLDRGLVYTYLKFPGNNAVFPLPISGEPYWNFYFLNTGGITFVTNFYLAPGADIQFRYIIVPGGAITSGRKSNIDFKNYDAVKSYYGIPD